MNDQPLTSLISLQGLPSPVPQILVISSADLDQVEIFFWIESDNINTTDTNASTINPPIVFGLTRNSGEIVSKFLTRCTANVKKKLNPKVNKKKKKTKQTTASHQPQHDITFSETLGHNVDTETHSSFWSTGQVISINDTDFRVLLNPPTISQLTTFQHGRTPIHVGTPIAPLLQTINGVAKIRWEWRRHRYLKGFLTPSSNDIDDFGSGATRDNKSGDDDSWPHGTRAVIVGRERLYTPTEADLGFWLSIQATPVSEDGDEITGWSNRAYIQMAVSNTPHIAACTLRKDWIAARKRRTAGSVQDQLDGKPVVRCMSYNILADSNVMLHSVEKTSEMPTFANRAMVVLREIIEHDSDLICLQEVDGKAYFGLLEPVLFELGWDGFWTNKLNGSQEGCAMFWRVSVFSVRSIVSASVADLVRANTDLTTFFTHRPHVFDICVNRVTTIAQVAVLEFCNTCGFPPKECGSAGAIIVANTHLFYHPDADHIRLLQTHSLVKHIHDNYAVPALLCGDLNSDPNSAAARLLLDGVLEPAHESWSCLDSYRWTERNTEGVESTDAEDQLLPPPSPERIVLPCAPFVSFTGTPSFTNYVSTFVETLDYVLYSPCGSHVKLGREGCNSPSVVESQRCFEGEGEKENEDDDEEEAQQQQQQQQVEGSRKSPEVVELVGLSVAPMPNIESLVDAGVQCMPCAGYASDHVSILADIVVKFGENVN